MHCACCGSSDNDPLIAERTSDKVKDSKQLQNSYQDVISPSLTHAHSNKVSTNPFVESKSVNTNPFAESKYQRPTNPFDPSFKGKLKPKTHNNPFDSTPKPSSTWRNLFQRKPKADVEKIKETKNDFNMDKKLEEWERRLSNLNHNRNH